MSPHNKGVHFDPRLPTTACNTASDTVGSSDERDESPSCNDDIINDDSEHLSPSMPPMQTTLSKESKQTVHIKASCARCGVYLTQWSLVRVSPLPQIEESPLMRSIVDLGTTKEPDTSDFFPSHLKSTYIGPEHAILFDDIVAAKSFLGKAVDLNRTLVPESLTASLKECPDKVTQTSNSKRTPCTPQIPQSPVIDGLVCPSCLYLLASHPTSSTIMMGIEQNAVVLYKRSLTLSTANVPFATETTPSIPSLKKPACHNQISMIHSRTEFEAILLESAVASSIQGKNKRKTVSTQAVIHDDGKSMGTQIRDVASATTSNSALNECDDSNNEDDVNNSTASNGMMNDASCAKPCPEELVIVMVGEFWSPFSVSAVHRLSDYNCRHSLTSSDGTKRLESLVSDQPNDSHDLRFNSATCAGSSPVCHRKSTTMLQNSEISNETTNNMSNTIESSNAASFLPTTSIVPGLLSSNRSQMTRPFSKRGGNMRCTFLLLDSLQCAGGTDPSTVLFSQPPPPPPASASTSPYATPTTTTVPLSSSSTAIIPDTFPSFHVWFRGCRVLVESKTQHFRCSDGAIVGLDLARHADLVVPRIARQARFAHDKAMMIRTLSSGSTSIANQQQQNSPRQVSSGSLRRQSCMVGIENSAAVAAAAAAASEERRSSAPLGSVKAMAQALENTSYSRRTSETGQDLDQLPVLKIALVDR